MSANTREPGELLHGQLFDRQEGVVTPFTQQVQNFNVGGQSPHVGNPNVEIVPIDANSTQDKVFDYAAASTARAALFVAYDCFIQMDLPDVLTNLTVYYNKTTGTGTDTHTGLGGSVGTSWAIGFNLPGRANSSVSIIPDVVPVLERFDGQHVPATSYRFFIAGNVTRAGVIAKLATNSVTVTAFPQFKTETFTLVLFGQQISLAADVNAQQQASRSDTNTTFTQNSGIGYSIQTGVSTNRLVIPPCLHGTITLPNPTSSQTLAATSTAGWTGSGAGAFNSITNPFPTFSVTSTVPTQTAVASVNPGVLAATSPAALPLFGLYLYDYKVEHYQDGDAMVIAYVVNMNVFGPSLSAMTISHGTLSPAFAPGTKNYTATSSDASITLTPTWQESGASIKVNGSTVTSGSASGSISLAMGDNRIVVIVTDNSAKTTTYVLIYTRT